MKRVLCIWLPDWPIQRLGATRPGPEEPSDPLADREALDALAEQCGRFSPLVAVEESADPECLLLDVTGLAHLFGGETALARKIVDDFTRRRLTARVAVADTIGAAWAVVHCQGSGVRSQGAGVRSQGSGAKPQAAAGGLQIENCKLKIANCDPEVLNPEPRTLNPHRRPSSTTHRPLPTTHRPLPTTHCPLPTAHCPLPTAHYSPGFTIVPPGGSLTALRPLPVAALRLPEETVGLLRQLGIVWIGQLEALPRGELSSRFTPELLRRWDQATGRRAEPVPARRPAPQLAAEWSADHPTARRETVEAVLEQLIGEVAAMLRRLGHGAVRLECRLDCTSSGAVSFEPMGPVEISVGLFEPTASVRHLFELVQMQMERLRMTAPVSAIRVTATDTAPLVCRQQELFFQGDGSPEASSRHLAALVDRLSSRLGRRSVVRAKLISDAQPERAWRGDPMLGDSRRRHRRRKTPAELPPRPLRLLPRPIALAATSIAPDGPPLRFHCCGHQHRIAHTWGPERIETGWWRGRTVGRDYYCIETTTGRRFWLFCRLGDGRWFLHGTFE